MQNGFFRAASCSPKVTPTDVNSNISNILTLINEVCHEGADLAVFPELAITGYTCGDLFHNSTLLDATMRGIRRLVDECPEEIPMVLVGAPVMVGHELFDCAIAFSRGKVYGVVPKTYLSRNERRCFAGYYNYLPNVIHLPGFDEDIPFDSGVFDVNGVKVGAEIGDDLCSPTPPSCRLALSGAQVIANLSASYDITGKHDVVRALLAQQSARCVCGYVYASAGYGESSTDYVYLGKNIISENGKILKENDRNITKQIQENGHALICDIDIESINHDRLHNSIFGYSVRLEAPICHVIPTEAKAQVVDGTLLREVNPMPFVPSTAGNLAKRCEEVLNFQVAGLCKRLEATGCKNLVIGISGGLDSTLALLVAIQAFELLNLPFSGLHGITMPGFGTSDRTFGNALTLMKAYGITMREISIAAAVEQHFHDIGHDKACHDVTYENSQARERTQILMDVANQVGGMVLGTGDLSELALGWCTYNGDHMSMYGVNADVPKTLVRHMVRYFATQCDNESARKALLDIVDTPISPELIPADDQGNITQKTEDLVGPYELHDFFLYNMLRHGFGPRRIYLLATHAFENKFDDDTIRKWLKVFMRRFFNQQFKRSCMPDGPKVGSVGISPRGDWSMPSDASSRLWLAECEAL